MCNHTKIARQALKEMFAPARDVSRSKEKCGTYMQFEETVSKLPLTAASCPRSTKLDFHLGQVARQGGTVIVPCPKVCIFCGTHRGLAHIKDRRGVLMSSYGPCKLNVRNSQCQDATCAREASADGRKNCMTFENTTTGITHTAMRQTCKGVALGSGTLTARIQELLKKHVTIRNAGIGDDSVEPRSVKTLLRVCVLGMHLMTKDPPSYFFTFLTCQPFISTPTNAILRLKMNALALMVSGLDHRAICQNLSPILQLLVGLFQEQ